MNSLTPIDFRSHSAKTLRSQSSLYSISKGLSYQMTYLDFFFYPQIITRKMEILHWEKINECVSTQGIERDVTTPKTNVSQDNALKNVTFYEIRFPYYSGVF